ncbi:MAG: PepSY-like domain-containing protein [Bacteroidales bacterium]|nr:PepSY-like domain-containing protein [Bacteroidales bacterium]
MKKLIGLSLVVFLSFQLNAQTITKNYSNEEIGKMITDFQNAHSRNTTPSAEILQKFRTDFPNARDIEWEVGGDTYEVEFDVKYTDYKAYYDNKGNLLMYTYDLSPRQLPSIVKNAVMAKYHKYKIEDVNIIYQGTEVFYKVEIEHNEMPDMKLIVKEDGSLVKEWND